MASTRQAPLTSTMAETSRWLDMFETLCARYHCRSVESLAGISLDRMNYHDVFFIGGPSAKWLAEVTSVALTRSTSSSSIRLVESSATAVRELVNLHEQMELRDRAVSRCNDEIVLDWFAVRSTGVAASLNFTSSTAERDQDDGFEERRQCILRVDRNNAIITVLLLANTTNLQELSPIGISCNPHIEQCLRPFLFIFACELAIRGVSYENLNLYQDAFPPSATCWLTKAREMHKRAKWLRVTEYKSDAELRDRIMCQQVNTTNVRLSWRDGYVFRSASSLFASKSAHLLPISAVIDLSAIYRDVRYNERLVLSLCDFGVFFRRCEKNFASNWSIPSATSSKNMRRSNNAIAAAATLTYELAVASTSDSIDDETHDKRRKRDLHGYESRYFVNANNELISRRFVQLS